MPFRPPRSLEPKPTVEGLLTAFQHEAAQERAASLGEAGRRLEAALAALRAFDEVNPPSASAGEREALIAEASERLWRYVVQREACGLRNTETLMREFGVPAVVRLRMGVCPRVRAGAA